MKAFVCIKQVPDTLTKMKLKPDGSGVDYTGVKWVVNPYDEFAIEEAVKSKEAGKLTQVIAVSCGPKARVVEALRTALAMGVDEAIVIDAPEDLDPSVTSAALAKVIAQEGPADLVFTGKLAIDDNLAAVGQMLAAKISASHVSVVSKLDLGGELTAEREIEGGSREIYGFKTPAVLTANKGLNTPRYTSLPGIMKAKKKVIKELTLAQLELDPKNVRMRHTQFELPAEKPPAQLLAGEPKEQAAKLVQLLRSEAKVI